jgi:hypothetical protein
MMMPFMAPLLAGYRWLQAAVAGLADFDQVLKSQATVQTRAEVERMVMLSVAAELAGFSLAPADLTLRLIPYFIPHVYQWRRIDQKLDDITGNLQPGC